MMISNGDIALHFADDGPRDAPAVVFAHALGTDLTLWDAMIAHLPEGLRLVRLDMRGHGGSDAPPAPYSMGQLVSDAEAVLDALGLRDVVFVGISIGGMIAQGLAVKRLDLVRGVVLSNTAARIGTRSQWDDRIASIRAQGLHAMVEPTLERWFAKGFRASPVAHTLGTTLSQTNIEGYTGCAAAIAGTDFYTPTSGLRLPCLGIAGSHDGSTPPDLVRETVELIPGSSFALMRRSGHLPCVDAPEDYARILTEFLESIGHVAT
ncbi:3-oxoadipate enol-lactonase [Celeribacter arenosi]|uniref:3-oxoadipate enol-lactonase n=1 Tax=Celeribacter arenosi TaxID=792649 RepID=A0ABP7K6S1_9RHOB